MSIEDRCHDSSVDGSQCFFAVPAPELRQRWQTLAEALPVCSLVLVYAGAETYRNKDADYPFRAHSHFLYLAGFNEAEAVFALKKSTDGVLSRHVFVQAKDPKTEIWSGWRLGKEKAGAYLDCESSHNIEQWLNELTTLLADTDEVWFSFTQSDFFMSPLMQEIQQCKKLQRSGKRCPQRWQDLDGIVDAMRLIKSPWEVSQIQQAAQRTVKGHLAAMTATKRLQGTNATEAAIEGEITSAYKVNSAAGETTSHAFNPIVATGANGCVLHYVQNNASLDWSASPLVLVDSGCEHGYYAGDVTTTFPLNGRFTPVQARIYELVLKAQQAAIESIMVGVSYDEPHRLVKQILTQGLIEWGIIQQSLEEALENNVIAAYFMHGTGHWLGLDVHDVGAYKTSQEEWVMYQAGMVVTVEPGLYFQPDDETVPVDYRGIGVRIEDDVLVTNEGARVLTSGLPRTVAEIEAWMASPSATH